MSDPNKIPLPLVNIYKLGLGDNDRFYCCPLHITLFIAICWIIEIILIFAKWFWSFGLNWYWWYTVVDFILRSVFLGTEAFFFLALIKETPLWALLYLIRDGVILIWEVVLFIIFFSYHTYGLAGFGIFFFIYMVFYTFVSWKFWRHYA